MIWSKQPKIQIFNSDCMPHLELMKDDQFDLAIVDPPYGIGESNKDRNRNGYGIYRKRKSYDAKDWDKKAPDEYYFSLLKARSKNQIIWGANHFLRYTSPCWVVWDKLNGNTDFADCELAYTSFNTAVRKFVFQWAGMLQGDMKNKEHRIHPTQKPIALYKWLLKNYAKEGNTILDTHLGSGSIAIACYDMGFDLTGFEIDKDYYNAAYKRFSQHITQLTLF